MTMDLQSQLKKLQELIDQINRRLDTMLGLTEAMSEALEIDDLEKFEDLISKRQELMDNIDDLNRDVRKIRLTLDIPLSEQNQPDQLGAVISRRQELLSEIQHKDAVNREAALLRSEQYKAMLREVRNQRDMQQYERENIPQDSIFIDTKG